MLIAKNAILFIAIEVLLVIRIIANGDFEQGHLTNLPILYVFLAELVVWDLILQPILLCLLVDCLPEMSVHLSELVNKNAQITIQEQEEEDDSDWIPLTH